MKLNYKISGAILFSLAGIIALLLSGILAARTQESPLHPI